MGATNDAPRTAGRPAGRSRTMGSRYATQCSTPRARETAIKFHPAADVFPCLEGEPFEALVADIRKNGLRELIVLHPDGRILDGRNRYRACFAAGVEPRFKTWDEKGSAVAFVVSLNVHRRHLDGSQRGMVAARIATLKQGERADRSIDLSTTQAHAAALLNISVATVKRAREVLDSGDADLIASVDQGEIAVAAAAKVAHARTNEPRNALRRSKAALLEVAKLAQRKDDGPSNAECASKGSASTRTEGDREPSPFSTLLKTLAASTTEDGSPFMALLGAEIGANKMHLIDAATPYVKRAIVAAVVLVIDERLGEVAS